jgi:diguanylate cyclase (GGDEF)-like protein
MPDLPTWTAEAALSAMVDALDEGALVFDEELRCRAAGRRVAELFGVDPRTLLGVERPALVARLSEAFDDPPQIMAAVGDPARVGPATVADPLEIVRPRARTVVWTSLPIRIAGDAVGRLDILRDVTAERSASRAHEEMAKKLEEVTTVDAVTELPNRRRFEQESYREHRRAQRAWDSYAIARFDVDGMKALNDTHGISAGDEIMKRVGEVLRASRREYDLVARWDGDEFIVLLPGAERAAVRTVVKRVVRTVRDSTFPVVGGLRVTVCAGAALWVPPSGEGASDIIRRAGTALAVARQRAPCSLKIDTGYGEWKDEPTEP